MNRVVLVEDERILALTLKSELTRAGYQVVGIASTADDAVALARDLSPDVMVMDISLEGDRTGLDAADEIAAFSQPRLFFVTGETDEDCRQRAAANPCAQGYFSKPVDVARLLAALRQGVEA